MRDWIDSLTGERSFEEMLLLLCLGLATLVVSVAAVVRALSGETGNAIFDAVIAVTTLLLAIYVWRTGRSRVVAVLAALFCLTVVVAVIYLFDGLMLLWTYPGFIVTFFLLRKPMVALELNGAALAALTPALPAFGAWPDIAIFLITLITTNLLALIFAEHMHRSRARLLMMAERDALTGARNRHAMEPMLQVALDKATQHETPASLMVIDLDRFKDTHGHEVGDRVLRQITDLLIGFTRAGDDVFRYGGEELVILANGASSTHAARLAEKLRRRIAETEFEQVGQVTISIGVAEVQPGDTTKSWFHRADQWMYQAKRAGRNRIIVEGSEFEDSNAAPDEA